MGEPKRPEEIICALAGIESMSEVPQGLEFRWAGKLFFKVNEPVPLDGLGGFKVIGMFRDGDEIRVYATPHTVADGTPPDKVPTPKRITLAMASSSIFIEDFAFNVFFEQALPNELRWLKEELLDEPEEGVTEDAIAAALKKTGATDAYITRVLSLLDTEEDEEPPKPPKTK
jgi:hypothetical protein